jgi:hypothetical protein
MIHFQIAVRSAQVSVIDHEELLTANRRSLDQLAESVATLPPDLAEAAVRFARQPTAAIIPTIER